MMHRIEPPITPLKNNVIIENDTIFGKKLFLPMTSLMMMSSLKMTSYLAKI